MRQRDHVMQTNIVGATGVTVAGQQRAQILGGEIMLAQAVMRRCQPKPCLLHIIACGDQRECLGGARILLAQTGGADRQGDLGVAGRQTLRILIVAQCSGNLAAQQCGCGPLTCILHLGAAVAVHLCAGPSRRLATARYRAAVNEPLPGPVLWAPSRMPLVASSWQPSHEVAEQSSFAAMASRREAAAVFDPIQAMLFGPRPPACETPVMAR